MNRKLNQTLLTIKFFSITGIVCLIISCGSTPTKPDQVAQPDTTLEEAQPSTLTDIDQSAYQNAKQNLDEGDIKKAQNQFKTLSRKYPKNPKVMVNLATCQYLTSDFDNSAKTLEKVDAYSADVADYHNLKGLLSVQAKKFPDAEKAYLNAIKLNDKFANAHYNLALLYDIYFQDIKNAFFHYTKYLSLIDHEDQETKDWVEQLKYSLEL
ncbi:Outer membrane protein assembly factor BamD [Thalassocella blandensis]|nr:Outer membrane protein assembly factor BamD [Thalassocella blandensis]